MSDQISTKAALLTGGGIAIAGGLAATLAAALLIHLVPHGGRAPRDVVPAAATIHAFVTLNPDNTCTQRVKRIRNAYPVLGLNDSIDWKGLDASNGHTVVDATIEVHFHPNSDPPPSVGTPFTASDFVQNDATKPTGPSGVAIKGPDDYDYLSVKVAGRTCTFTDPGVHVDQ